MSVENLCREAVPIQEFWAVTVDQVNETWLMSSFGDLENGVGNNEYNAGQLSIETEAIREILSQHGRLSVEVNRIDDESDLYSVGLTSLATVGIMLALEDRFDIEFPESMLSRKTFKSIATIAEAVSNLAS